MTTIGILGAGQLGRMLALAGYRLGMNFRFFDPAADSSAGQLAPHIAAAYDDWAALEKFAHGLDVVTYEFENIPVETARFLEKFVPVYPPSAALEKSQDRLVEKSFFRSLGVPTPPFAEVNSRADLDNAVRVVGIPSVLKTRRMGYDGKGQVVISAESEVEPAWEKLKGTPLILESFILFDRELSLIGARNQAGHVVFYPLAENTHQDGILRRTVAPAHRRPQTGSLITYRQTSQSLAEVYMRGLMQSLNYVGVLALELFQAGDQLYANEMAPRVHNSGHWTIDGAVTSQFENHVRALAGLPLGSGHPLGVSAMLNLIGKIPDVASILDVDGAHLHVYGKSPRPGRKVGHVTVLAGTHDEIFHKIEELEELVGK